MASLLPGSRVTGDRELIMGFATLARVAYYKSQTLSSLVSRGFGGISSENIDNSGGEIPSISLARGNGFLIVGIEGTSSFSQWVSHVASSIQITNSQLPGKVHSGFNGFLAQIWGQVNSRISNNSREKIILCGHSMGGALATMMGGYIQRHYPRRLAYVVTFGEPRSGNGTYARGSDFRHIRVINANDPVPSLPPRNLSVSLGGFPPLFLPPSSWDHSGRPMLFDDNGVSAYTYLENPGEFTWFGFNPGPYSLSTGRFSKHDIGEYVLRIASSVPRYTRYPRNLWREANNRMNSIDGAIWRLAS